MSTDGSNVIIPKRKALVAAEIAFPDNAFPESRDHYRRNLARFQAAFSQHMRQYGDSSRSLWQAIDNPRNCISLCMVRDWKQGRHAPRSHRAFEFLKGVERRYGLPENYFAEVLRVRETALWLALKGRSGEQRYLIRQHIPVNFRKRTPSEQEEILNWINMNVLGGATEFGRYIRKACFLPYRMHFPDIHCKRERKRLKVRQWVNEDSEQHKLGLDIGVASAAVVEAPPCLSAEMADLISFKRSKIVPFGFRRTYRWTEATAALKTRTYGFLFGALAAPSEFVLGGLGLPRTKLTFGLLVFPALWEWYLTWREKRRGFHTHSELIMLRELLGITRQQTGWLRQHPEFSAHLFPIKGIISSKDIAAARKSWTTLCDDAYNYAYYRAKEIGRTARKHRDTLAPIMPVLNSDSPLAEYRKIADEVIRRLPDETEFPREAVIGTRSYLMLRFGMHLGLRQRNLRELLVCPRGDKAKSVPQLERMLRGELRWNERDGGWEVFIPAIAFKNPGSPFFGGGPFSLLLPDLENLYSIIDAYLKRHRPLLLGSVTDPGTFFVKTVANARINPTYSTMDLYHAWRRIIQCHGIYNPFTGRGAIEGLLPHGPHNVRDVLATHILKQTGSFELAGYAIQDTATTVLKHYGRFLPRDKTAKAAQVLDKVWT